MAEQALPDNSVIVWEPRSKPQAALLACPVFEVFFGGSRGSLKTDSMLGDWINHSGKYGEDAAGLMIRRTREELKETFERAKQIFIPLGFKFSGHSCKSPNGSRLTFAYLDHDTDADHYQGWSLTRVYVEEAGNFPTERPVMKLMATLRSAKGVPTGFRATGNPGGPGHQWVKRRYIDPDPKGWTVKRYEYTNPFTNKIAIRERVFIPGRITDHTLLGDQYIANLQMSGSESLVRAWLLGDWDVVEGAFFDCWDSQKHVIKPFEIPEHCTRFISGDWGFAAPFSFGWWAIMSDNTMTPSGMIPRGAMVRYREWYGANEPNVGIRLPSEDVGAELLRRTGSEKLSINVLDPSGFASDGGPSIAERLMKGADNKLLFRRADNKRVGIRGAMGGWDQMRGRLMGDERPMIYVFDTCKDSIRTIPALQHDADKAEDLDTTAEDHAADEWRYACMSRPYIRPSPTTTKPVWPYEGITSEKIIGNIPIRELIRRKERARRED